MKPVNSLVAKARFSLAALAALALATQLLAPGAARADVPVRPEPPKEASAPAQAPLAGPAAAAAPATAPSEAPRDLSKYKEESIPGGDLMIIAYLVMWGLLGGFAVRLAIRHGKLEREVATLQDRLDRGA